MECGFLLDVVIREGAAVFELFAGEDQALLIRRDTFFVWGHMLGEVRRWVKGYVDLVSWP